MTMRGHSIFYSNNFKTNQKKKIHAKGNISSSRKFCFTVFKDQLNYT